MKRAMDLTFGSVLAVLAVPVILVLAVGVLLTLRTNPFFVQRRVGRAGRPITIVKLRTLPRSAPPYAAKHELGEIVLTRFTRALRRLHLDELPQLLLVPLGSLSLVGPRPEMPGLHGAAHDAGFARERVQVRPGCTGLWQIGEGASGLIWDAPEYDRYYLRHRSFGLDLWILWRTAWVITGLASPVSVVGRTSQPVALPLSVDLAA